MDILLNIYFVLGILWLVAGIVIAFAWVINQLSESNYWLQENAREERQKLIEQFRQQLVDQQEIIYRERKDLYDRLQAGTLTHYKEHTEAPNEIVDTSEDDTVPLDEAKDDLMGVTHDE